MLLALLLLVGAGQSFTPDSHAANPASRHCGRLAHVLERGSQLVAFEQRSGTTEEIGVCNRASGRVRSLAGGTDYFFRPPGRAVAIRGMLIGYAVQEENDGVTAADDDTVLVIADLRHRRPNSGDGRVGLTTLLPFVDIGSLGITPRRQIAWIQCPDDSGTATGSERPNCLRAGGMDSVQMLLGPKPSQKTPVRLAHGSDIDPLSLRVTGDKASWTQAGRRHTVRFVNGER